ncbi:unnamed protein product [Nesidiocoris tenuis]|uniref:Reverse transcriptase domain-containing protein n=1 Tax=Nesidiocoris tenuis TaxID=355587 RepID=A0A6H5GGE3_9HEMI|nr:unnamed protein product [Nesidiocoris tenuis]
MVAWAERHCVLNEGQAGFRSGYSTADDVFVLQSLVQLRMAEPGQKLYCFYVDLRAAFDTIDWRALYWKMQAAGLSTKLVRAVEAVYSNQWAAVFRDGAVSEWFGLSSGLRQGCLLSPFLFDLFINDLWEAMGGGVLVGGAKIKVLAFADTLVLIAPDPVSLQLMITDLNAYSTRWSLSINLEKSKIMIFRNGGRRARAESWNLNGEPIEVVSKYKYLGVTLTPNLFYNEHFLERGQAVGVAVGKIWPMMLRTGIPIGDKWRVFDATAKAVVQYGAQVWGYKKNALLERPQLQFIRRLFTLPAHTPHYVLMLETNRPSMFLQMLPLQV